MRGKKTNTFGQQTKFKKKSSIRSWHKKINNNKKKVKKTSSPRAGSGLGSESERAREREKRGPSFAGGRPKRAFVGTKQRNKQQQRTPM